jgi:hypothetical protein
LESGEQEKKIIERRKEKRREEKRRKERIRGGYKVMSHREGVGIWAYAVPSLCVCLLMSSPTAFRRKEPWSV